MPHGQHEQLTPEQRKFVGIIISVMVFIGAVIVIAQELFSFFLFAVVVLFVLLIVVGLIELILRQHDYLEFWDYASSFIGVALLIALVGFFLTYFIGYGIGGTSLGVACVQVYTAVNGVQESLDQAINDVVESSCKTLMPENCELLRTTAKTAKTLQEVTDMADKLAKTAEVVETITKK
jgi:nitrogen fixation/metabolism regulation signal transduction histidine kinase